MAIQLIIHVPAGNRHIGRGNRGKGISTEVKQYRTRCMPQVSQPTQGFKSFTNEQAVASLTHSPVHLFLEPLNGVDVEISAEVHARRLFAPGKFIAGERSAVVNRPQDHVHVAHGLEREMNSRHAHVSVLQNVLENRVRKTDSHSYH